MTMERYCSSVVYVLNKKQVLKNIVLLYNFILYDIQIHVPIHH